MIHVDIELEGWREQWQMTPDTSPPDLRERVARQSRRARIFMIAPVLVTAIMGGGFSVQAAASPGAESITLAAAVWVFIAIAWGAGLLTSRGTWEPLADTTAAFIDLSIRRCRSTLRGLTFGVVLYVAELAFCIAWRVYQSGQNHGALMTVLASPSVVALGWVGLPAFVGFVLWYGRRKREELAHLVDLQRQLVTAD
jgi:hypothetical protein